MSATLTFLVNKTNTDDSYANQPSNFIQVDTDNDKIIASNGSSAVADGEVIPSASELNAAGILILGTDVVVPHYFLADASEGVLEEILLAGNQDSQYVFCASFDDATASEPRLEIWDNASLNTTALKSLGNGVPADSFWLGVVTTNVSAGEDWTGQALAGDGVNRFLWLNEGAGAGALGEATDLYFNLKAVIPANYQAAVLEQPVAVIKYTTN